MGRFSTGLARLTAGVLPKGFLTSMLQVVTSSPTLPPRRGTKEILQAYTTMPWLRAAVSKVGAATAETEWKLYREVRRGRTVRSRIPQMGYENRQIMVRKLVQEKILREVEGHEALALLDAGNDFMTGMEVRRNVSSQLDLVGEGFWLKERDGRGLPKFLWPLAPHWVESVPRPGGDPWFEVRMDGGQPTKIPVTEIVWFRDSDPADPYGRGSGTAKALGDELETDEYAAKHTKSWFYNGARPDFIVSADGLRKDETLRLEENWVQKHAGWWKAFRPHFLNRKVDVQQLSQTFNDMQMTDLRKYERDTIVQVYGIPPELLGILASSNRATIESSGFLFSRWVVVPRLEIQRAAIQRGLINDFDDRLILDYVTPVAEDKEFKAKVISDAPWAFSIDEVREMAGFDPVEDGTGRHHVIPQRFDIIETLDPRSIVPGTPELPAGGDDSK